jgi:chromate transporter
VVGSESVATSAGGPCLGRRLLLLAAWTLGIVGLALLGAQLWPHRLWLLFLACFRVGFLVFGGGHVVLPMLEAEMVDPGWLSQEQFLTGYALTQAMPGPIFTLSAYLGAAMQGGWLAIPSALVALLGIFGPSFLLVAILLPAWDSLRGYAPARAALAGVAAAVVGLLLAALFFPIASSAIKPASAPLDCALALAAFGLLALARWPAWLVVILAALAGGLLYREGLPATGWG